MGNATCSVLINNHNYAPYLRACIDSALAQEGVDREVIVVDDGSTDESRAIIESYGDAIIPVLKSNGGQASSFNAGFAAAGGDLCFLLDADDMFLPGKLARVADLYARHRIDWCFDRVTTDDTAEPSASLTTVAIDRRETIRRGRFPTLPVPTSGLSFRRDLLAQILPMPEAADVVLSDNYLKFAAAYLGRGIIIETPLTFQRIHASNRYTGSGRGAALRPAIMIATGTQLARRYGGLRRIGEQLIAGGAAGARRPIGPTWRTIRQAVAEAGMPPSRALRVAALATIKRVAQEVRRHAS